MDEFFSVVKRDNSILIKNFLKNNTFDINFMINKTRAIDIAWQNFLIHRNEDVLELLLNQNSVYPVGFDVNLLAEDSKIKKFVQFTINLHKQTPKLGDIQRYQHMVYFFDTHNKSLLLRLYEQKKINGDISRHLLLGPGESHHENLLMKLKSLIFIVTPFEKKCKKQSYCRIINQLFADVTDFIGLSSIVMYPMAGLRIIFDYMSPKKGIYRNNFTFIVSCKYEYPNGNSIVQYVSSEIFGVHPTKKILVELESLIRHVDVNELDYFKNVLDNRPVLFNGQTIKFSEIKPLTPIDKHLMFRILFNNSLISFGILPPLSSNNNPDIAFMLNNTYYSNIKFVVGYHKGIMSELLGMMSNQRPSNHWLWHIDLSLLAIDQFCTAKSILNSAYHREIKHLNKLTAYGWEIFLEAYTKQRVVLFFDGIDKLQLKQRVMTIIQNDFICERWIHTNDTGKKNCPKIDFYLIVDDLSPESLEKFILLLGMEYKMHAYYPPDNKKPFAVFGKHIASTQTFLSILFSLNFSNLQDFECVQVNFELFVKYNGTSVDINETTFKAKIKMFENKTYDEFVHTSFIQEQNKIYTGKYQNIVKWLSCKKI